jgi:hypothetical protein
VDALQDHPLAATVKKELAAIAPPVTTPVTQGLAPVANASSVQRCPVLDLEVTFGESGAVGSLKKAGKGLLLAGAEFGKFIYLTHSQEEFDGWIPWFRQQYFRPPCTNTSNCNHGTAYYKPNISCAGARQTVNVGETTSMWRDRSQPCSFLARMKLDPQLHELAGAPQEAYLNFTFTERSSGGGVNIAMELQLFNKTATRLPESMFFSFKPGVPGDWTVHKLASRISPLDVIQNGSQFQHGQSNGVEFEGADIAVHLQSHDVAIVSPDTPLPHAFPADKNLGMSPLQASDISGFSFQLSGNNYNTGYILWYPFEKEDAALRFRFEADILPT